MVRGDPGVVVIEIGEERQRVTEGMTARTPGFSAKDCEAPFGFFADRGLIASDETIERRVSRNQCALVRGERFPDELYFDLGAENGLEIRAIFGNRAKPL